MGKRTSRLALLLALAVPWPATGDDPAPVLTLEDAVAQALAGNRRIAIARLDVARAEDRTAQLKSQRLPVVDVNLAESRLLTKVEVDFPRGALGVYPATGPIPGETTTVELPAGYRTTGYATLTQPLSQLYKLGLGVDARKADEEASRQSLRAERLEAANAVRKAYYGILRAKTGLLAAGEALEASRELERLMRERLREEAILPGDHLESRARLARAEADLLSMRNALVTGKERLNALLGRDLGTAFDVADVPPLAEEGTDVALDSAREKATAGRPELVKARLTSTSAELDLSAKKADLWPDLSFTAGYVAPFGLDLLPRGVATVGVVLQWEVFDGGRKSRVVAEKRKAVEQASLARRETEAQVSVEVGANARRLAEARAQLRAAALGHEAAAERLRVTRERHRAEAALLGDLLNAQGALADAAQRGDEALLNYYAARADYEKSIGEEP